MLKVGIGLDRAKESCKVGKSWLTDKIMHPHELKGVNELTCQTFQKSLRRGFFLLPSLPPRNLTRIKQMMTVVGWGWIGGGVFGGQVFEAPSRPQASVLWQSKLVGNKTRQTVCMMLPHYVSRAYLRELAGFCKLQDRKLLQNQPFFGWMGAARAECPGMTFQQWVRHV